MVGKFKSSRLLGLNRLRISRGGCSHLPESGIGHAESGDGQPDKPPCDIPPGLGARKRYDA